MLLNVKINSFKELLPESSKTFEFNVFTATQLSHLNQHLMGVSHAIFEPHFLLISPVGP